MEYQEASRNTKKLCRIPRSFYGILRSSMEYHEVFNQESFMEYLGALRNDKGLSWNTKKTLWNTQMLLLNTRGLTEYQDAFMEHQEDFMKYQKDSMEYESPIEYQEALYGIPRSRNTKKNVWNVWNMEIPKKLYGTTRRSLEIQVHEKIGL